MCSIIELDGQIIKWEETNSNSYDMIVSVKKQDKLQNYEGMSGGPITICGNVIGFAVRQLSDNKIAGISLKCLKKILPEVYSNKIMVSSIRKTAILHSSSLVEKCDLDFFENHLNFDYLLHQEYKNPLYLKMLCEVAQTQKNLHAEAEDLMKLMKDFFEMKDKKISKEICISVREHIVRQILDIVADSMLKQSINYIQWSELRAIVKEQLSEYNCERDTQHLLKKLLSENLLKEADNDNKKIVFGYERFYEIIMAQRVLASTEHETIQGIYELQEKQKMTIGTLELIQILFMRQFQHEILEYFVPEEWG